MFKQFYYFLYIIGGISLLICEGGISAPIEIGVGTRAQGMGGAFVGVADDASATYWNPAGLGKLEDGEARFMHWLPDELQNVSIEWFGLSYPFTLVNPQGIGISWLRKGASLEQGRDTITTSMSENTYSFSYGFSLVKKLIVGVTANRFSINSNIGSSSGVGIDAGLLYVLNPYVKMGFIARNLSANLGDENFLPTYRTGIAIGTQKFVIVTDVSTKDRVNGKDNITFHYFGGLEIKIIPQFAVRIGYNDNNPINAGIGVNIKNVLIEYAYSNATTIKKTEGLTNSHRIELGYKFYIPSKK
ncbi:MAG: hypothetical protein PHX21_07895 [bacterium]|nr:hypothetical protein [bacterium]